MSSERTQEPSRSQEDRKKPSFSQLRPFGAPVAGSHSHRVISVLPPAERLLVDQLVPARKEGDQRAARVCSGGPHRW